MKRSFVLVPGHAPHWVADHARHLAQRLTESGRVMVVFTHASDAHTLLPGQPGNASVLGHSVSGSPIWTGRLRAAFGFRPAGAVTVVVLWNGANHGLALWSALVARARGERVVLDMPEAAASHPPFAQRVLRPIIRRLASACVLGEACPAEPGHARVALALCGADRNFAQLILKTFEGMSEEAAKRWRLIVQLDQKVGDLAYTGRREGKVSLITEDPSIDVMRSSDVLIADFGGKFEDYAHQAVLSGGAGVVVGQPVASRIAHCHDGVWFAQRDPASILVALEASSGDLSDRPGSMLRMREITNEVVQIVERSVAAVNTVVICAYTEDRWDVLCESVESVRGGSADDEVVLVIDHNDALLARSRDHWADAADVVVVPNRFGKGLSGRAQHRRQRGGR